MLVGPCGVDLVPERLERADDDGRRAPFPDAQRGAAPPCVELLGQHLVEREVHRGLLGPFVDDLEDVVVPPGRVAERAAHRDRHGLGREPDHGDVVGQDGLDGSGQVGDGRGLGQPRQGRVDVLEGVVGLEEEVAAQRDA
ncbi:hypothetical protein D3C74_349230 [compost metagenome]